MCDRFDFQSGQVPGSRVAELSIFSMFAEIRSTKMIKLWQYSNSKGLLTLQQYFSQELWGRHMQRFTVTIQNHKKRN